MSIPAPASIHPEASGARSGGSAGFWASGMPFVWLSGGTLAVCLLMIGGLLGIILMQGLTAFWPVPVAELRLQDGTRWLGELSDHEAIPEADLGPEASASTRTQVRVGNRDLYGADFRWIDDDRIASIAYPSWIAVLERLEWGNFYGKLVSVRHGEEVIAQGSDESWSALSRLLPDAVAQRERIRELERDRIGALNAQIEEGRLAIRKEEASTGGDPARRSRLEAQVASAQREYETVTAELERLRARTAHDVVIVEEVGGRSKEIPVAGIVRAFRPNQLRVQERMAIYGSRLWEFVSAEPREANTEGGIFPAIFGTCLMVVLMSLAVVPFGVLAAIYLREYARQGPLVRVVRIAVNNLAGVPSIVFGVFGLGFFVYFVGGSLDHIFFSERLPAPTFGTGGILWASLTLALLTVPVVIVATEEALSALPREVREGSLALGATQWETIRRVLLPAALPGILTGAILAMARGAGEVAPLMITGVVKLAPTLPIDGQWPYLHLERKFMHLGFHIYDVGFQSPNVEAAKPMVYTTTLLLLGVVLLINVLAIWFRNRLRQRHRQAGV